jgi:hypothetical protein
MIKVASVPVLVFPARYLAAHYERQPTPEAAVERPAVDELAVEMPAIEEPQAPDRPQVLDPALERLLTSKLVPAPQRPPPRTVRGRQARRHVIRWRSKEGLERIAADRRRELRVPVDFLANHYIKGVPHICRVTNVSRHGALVDRIGGPLASESTVELELRLPGHSSTTHLTGQVTHRTERSFGVLLSETDEYQQQFVRYIDSSIASIPMT